MFSEAADPLEKYIDRRPVDPEGLYYFGKVLKERGETEKAAATFEQAVESVNIAPHYRRRELKRWSQLARKEM
jgi:hypothetical protein